MGRLEVITGPMFSGKSEELIRRLTRAKIAGKNVVAFHPTIETRYGTNILASHSGSTFESVAKDSVTGMLNAGPDGFHPYDVIGIDEAQFFSSVLPEVITEMIKRGKIVIVAGLDMTYRQEPFGSMPTLMTMADTVLKLSAVCASCGNDAMMTQRLINGEPAPFTGETVLVGGLESYEARCRLCFEAR